MKVERLERSKRQQERILVFLEGADGPLRITEDELLHFGLYSGLDISPETVLELQKCAARSQTRARAANMISARPLSRRELCRRLTDRGAAEDDAEAAADWLERIGALDDLAYAKALVRHYSAGGYGAAKLRDELFRRGVPRALWEEALESALDAQETIGRYLAAKTKGAPQDGRARKRLADALRRRGFSWDEIRPALEALDGMTEEDETAWQET